MDVVYATGTFFIGLTKVEAGTYWPADDPIVRARPDGFSPDPVRAPGFRATEVPKDYPVEQATNAPGEKRNTRRG